MMQHPWVRDSGETAAEMAHARIREGILSGRLPAGTKLNQADLANELGMSRIPVRDALRALAGEGLVEDHPRRTARVASLSLGDVAELYEIRIAIEPQASAMAVSLLTETDLDEIRAALGEVDASDDAPAWLTAHDRFHELLYQRSQRPRMIELLDHARAQTRRYTWIRLDRDADEIAAEHHLILAAVERRDARSVRALIQAHLAAGYEIVSRRLAALVPATGLGAAARGGDVLAAHV